MIIVEVFLFWLRHRSLCKRTCNRVGTIEHYHFGVALGGSLQQISQSSWIRIETGACILDIHQHSVELLQNIDGRAALGVGVSVQAINGYAGDTVSRLVHVRSIGRAKDSMLGAEDGGQF